MSLTRLDRRFVWLAARARTGRFRDHSIGMTEIGRELAEARARAGLSVEELSRRTKLSVPTLLAIERNQMGTLPGGLYARAMLRAYAREVGCNPEDIVRRF